MPGILKIAVLCIAIGAASIPVSFGINSNPFIVWLGNALGSLFSAVVVIYIGDHLTSDRFKTRISKRRFGKKIVNAFNSGEDNKRIAKVKIFINKHGLRVFAFLCPIFPGVLVATSAVYVFNLDKKRFKHWMFAGIFAASGAYVFGYWITFVKHF